MRTSCSTCFTVDIFSVVASFASLGFVAGEDSLSLDTSRCMSMTGGTYSASWVEAARTLTVVRSDAFTGGGRNMTLAEAGAVLASIRYENGAASAPTAGEIQRAQPPSVNGPAAQP